MDSIYHTHVFEHFCQRLPVPYTLCHILFLRFKCDVLRLTVLMLLKWCKVVFYARSLYTRAPFSISLDDSLQVAILQQNSSI